MLSNCGQVVVESPLAIGAVVGHVDVVGGEPHVGTALLGAAVV